jgi:hypothetical protein
MTRRRKRKRRRRVRGDDEEEEEDDDDDEDCNEINTAFLMTERYLWNCRTNTSPTTTETSTSRQSLNFVFFLEIKVS